MAVASMKSEYSREEVRRLLGVTERQLLAWERQELFPARATYSMRDLVKLRTLEGLRQERVPAPRIKQALASLSRNLRHEDPLAEFKVYAEGKRLRVKIAGSPMEVSGQLLFDFDKREVSKLLDFRAKRSEPEARSKKAEAESWFQKGLELEQGGAPVDQVLEAYNKALECDPGSAGALVNMGTIHFNARRWQEAERFYKQALLADPEYALAHFDLGNLYDERGQRAKALEHYETALKLSPKYADAHYNVALLYQGSNQVLKAVWHWKEYLKLDPRGHWANIAKRELEKLERATIVRGSRA